MPKTIPDLIKEMGEMKSLSFDIQMTLGNGEKHIRRFTFESTYTINELITTTLISKAIGGDSKAIDLLIKHQGRHTELQALAIAERRAKVQQIIKALNPSNRISVKIPRPTAKKHNRKW